jgi:signal transduction histidine kinase
MSSPRLPADSKSDRLLVGISEAFTSVWRRTTTVSRVNDRDRLENELRELSGHLINAHEEERLRLARELHDDVAQRVALLTIELSALAQESKKLPSHVNDQITRLSSAAAALGGDIHRLSHQLHPAILRQLGLAAAIHAFCRDLSETRHVTIDVQVSALREPLHEDVTLCIYRVAQEALHNVVRHSRAPLAVVTLATTESQVVLTVRDGGVGFDPHTPIARASVGLTSMRERVRLVNGQFSVCSQPGEGTSIEARVPVGFKR